MCKCFYLLSHLSSPKFGWLLKNILKRLVKIVYVYRGRLGIFLYHAPVFCFVLVRKRSLTEFNNSLTEPRAWSFWLDQRVRTARIYLVSAFQCWGYRNMHYTQLCIFTWFLLHGSIVLQVHSKQFNPWNFFPDPEKNHVLLSILLFQELITRKDVIHI